MNSRRLNRRNFLKGASLAAAALGFPYVIPSRALGEGAVPPPSERVLLGHIGVGGQGSGLLGGFLGLEDCQSVAVCDAYGSRREASAARINQAYAERSAKGSYKGCAQYEDFRELLARKDIDAVVIATPDHWHVPIALAAARAGKDTYVEKPLGISIEENKALREAIHRYARIFQYGTQQRCFNTHCAFVCELVRNGRIGQLREIVVDAPGGSAGGSAQPIPPPKDLNYEMWLGPVPFSPYTADRCGGGGGSWFVYANSLGFLGGWGAHPLDIMHWGYPHIPVEYEGVGTIPSQGLYDTITNWNVRGRFASGVAFVFKDGGDKTLFTGDEGWVWASRGGMDANPKSLLREIIRPDEIHLLQSNDHYQNFIDAVKRRTQPASPIDSAVQSDFISHLSDIAIRTGRKITWDPMRETILGDEPASRMLTRPMRSPWTL